MAGQLTNPSLALSTPSVSTSAIDSSRLKDHKRVTAISRHTSHVLPLLIALILIVPPSLPFAVFGCVMASGYASLSGTGYTIDGVQATHPLKFFSLSSEAPSPDLLSPLPRLLLAQFIFGILLLVHASTSYIIYLYQRRWALSARKVAYNIPASANWIGVSITIILTFCVLVADIGVFCYVKKHIEGVGDLRLEIGGYVMLCGGGGLLVLWLNSAITLALLLRQQRRMEEKQKVQEVEGEFMPDKVEFDGDRVKVNLYIP